VSKAGKPFTRAGDLPPACFELLFEIDPGLASSTNARLRFGPMKLATSRSARRLFARQGHLYLGSPRVSPSTSRIAPLISTRSFFGGASLKSARIPSITSLAR
jgi:hypothetical protein